jgi:hypothetical protein
MICLRMSPLRIYRDLPRADRSDDVDAVDKAHAPALPAALGPTHSAHSGQQPCADDLVDVCEVVSQAGCERRARGRSPLSLHTRTDRGAHGCGGGRGPCGRRARAGAGEEVQVQEGDGRVRVRPPLPFTPSSVDLVASEGTQLPALAALGTPPSLAPAAAPQCCGRQPPTLR